MQCTWSPSSECCDRCRRLDKKCHLRKSSSLKEDQPRQEPPSEPATPQAEMFGLSDSTAAALALTELSAASEEKRSPVKPAIKEPSPFESPGRANPYQVGGRPSMQGFSHESDGDSKSSPPATSEVASYYEKTPEKRSNFSSSGPTPAKAALQIAPTSQSSASIIAEALKSTPNHKRKLSRKYGYFEIS
jgi:hypothetical protein